MTESRDDNDPIYGGVFFVPEEAPDELGVTTDHAARALAHAGFDKSQAVKFWQARIAARAGQAVWTAQIRRAPDLSLSRRSDSCRCYSSPSCRMWPDW